jgi:FKBP-type peptidyl-prolyl cis-trans isomerase (trigger factor)
MWEHYRKAATVKRLPEGDVLEYYDDYVAEITAQYNAAADNYNSLEEYAMLHLELDRNVNWLDHMRKIAEDRVTEKIIFYYIIRNEKISPTEKEYKELYDKTVDEHLASFLTQVGCTKDDYDTEDEYNKAVERYKESMMAAYGDEYFKEAVIYLHAIGTLRGYANIIYDK